MNLRKLSELIELKCIFCVYVNSVVITRETLRRAYLGALKNDLTLFNNCLDLQIKKETLEVVRKNLEEMRANSHGILYLFVNHRKKLMNEVNRRISRDHNLVKVMEKTMDNNVDTMFLTEIYASRSQRFFYVQIILEQGYFRKNWERPGREK
jgi:hypothetical protein